MTEERIVETRSPDGQTSTHTTVVTEGRERRGGSTALILLALAALLVVGIWGFNTMGGAEVAKDNAIADAAADVGTAASQVGDAAQDAAGAVAD